MSATRFAILDPAAGISGDMLLGALVDVGAPAEWLQGLPARLGLPGVRIEIGATFRCGVACTRVTVRLADGRSEGPSPSYVAPHAHELAGAHDHSHDPRQPQADTGVHHHLGDLARIVERAPLSTWVRERALKAFRLLCEEEGRIHGVPAEQVALHEVGAVDAIVDIVGGIEGFERLGIDRVSAWPVALGNGWVRAAHGVMPVPAPVTVRLLEGLEIGPNGPVVGEATTPTGAVLLRVLGSGPPPARWRMGGTGWGAGGRDPEHYPNALRLVLATSVAEAGEVVTLSSDLDDLSPEYIEPLREALVAAGGLDVQLWMTQMKKGRPGFRVEVVCDPSAVELVTEAFFLHSTTSGIRRSVAERITLPRHQIEILGPDGSPVLVKVIETSAGPRVKAEYDDVRRTASRVGRPAHEVARDIETAARARLAEAAAGSSRSPKENG